jgi:hypothetical protein
VEEPRPVPQKAPQQLWLEGNGLVEWATHAMPST